MEVVFKINGPGGWAVHDTGDAGFFREAVGTTAFYSYIVDL